MARLTPDSDTLFLFDFEDFVSGSRALVIDDVGNNNLLFTGSAYFVDSQNGTDTARVFETNGFQATKHNVTDAFLTASRGDCTVEAWIWPDPGHGANTFFLAPNGSGETADTDFTLRWTLQADNRWEMFHEYGGGTNVAIVQTTATVTSGEWNHVALVRRASGSNIAIDIYTNGTLSETKTAAGQLPGSTAGTNIPDMKISYDGIISSVRFSDIVRSGSEVSASAARSDYMHTTDANTIAHWKMNEAPNFRNRGTSGRHLTIKSGEVYKASPLVADTTSSLHFRNAHCHTVLLNDQVATEITGNNNTIDFWFNSLYDSPEQNFSVWGEDLEVQSTNYLFHTRLLSSGKFYNFFETGAGVNHSYTTTSSLTQEELHNLHYFVMVTIINTASNTQIIDYYLDGQLWETSSGSSILPIPEGGTAARLECPGYQVGGTFSNTTVNMQQYRISKRAFTPEEILANYQAGTTSSNTGTSPVDIFRGLSGSQYVFFRSDETQPPGLTSIVKVGEDC